MRKRRIRASRPDPHSPDQRRYNMSRIRSVDTKPEIIVRRALHAAGFRFRLYDKSLPGSPDLVLTRYRSVVFIHGCFWHGHGCSQFRLPATRAEFWESKISANRVRDQQSLRHLRANGWRTLVIWECALRGRGRLSSEELLHLCAAFFRSECAWQEVAGSEF